jgi:hypothetical protein
LAPGIAEKVSDKNAELVRRALTKYEDDRKAIEAHLLEDQAEEG